MILPRRLTTPRAAAAAFAAAGLLVAAALAWVTARALDLEASQLAAAAAADRANRERVALWRLDGSLLPAVGAENARPFAHYTALHTVIPAAPADHPPGDVRLPSPLLSAELPDWMPLHFQLDPAAGWESPQVPPAAVADQLQSPPNDLILLNVTPEREDLLARLAAAFPPADAAVALAARTLPADAAGAFAVPVPAPPPAAVSKPAPPDPPGDTATLPPPATEKPGAPRAAEARPNLGVNPYLYNTAPPIAQATTQQPLTPDPGEYGPRTRASQNAARSGQFEPPTSANPPGANQRGGYNPPDANTSAQNTPAPDPRGRRKLTPAARPVAVQVGPLAPVWLTGRDGSEMLVLARAARLETRAVYQGVVLDWPRVQARFAAEVADLFPRAAFAPTRAGPAPPDRALSTLPVRFDPGPDPPPQPLGLTPLRVGLGLVWLAAAAALAAVALGGRALVDLSARRGRFVSAVTHELRTPLTSLRLYLDMLTAGLADDPEKRREYLVTMSGEADRLDRLVENVLDYARLEDAGGRANLRPTSTAALLADAADAWAARLAPAGLELVPVNTAPPAQEVLADPRLVLQVLGALIDNARKYAAGAADRRVWVWVRPAPRGRVAFEVEDRGPGVPPAGRRDLFRPFRRGPNADATAGGAGLGLALAKRWAALTGGTLTHRDADGGGACFRLELAGAPHERT